MPIDLGSLATVEWDAGAAASGHAVTLTITAPDGLEQTPAVTVSQTGKCTAQLVANVAGIYGLRWHIDDGVYFTDIATVWPQDPRYLISLADAIQSLGWRDPDAAKNADMLRLYIAAATPVIEDIVGTVLLRTITQKADGGRTGVSLYHRPDEVTSVTVDGKEATDYVVHDTAAIVYCGKYGERFPPGRQIITITYTTGHKDVSPNIQLATRELVRHLWQVGQQITTGTPADYGDRPFTQALTPSGFAVPKRVIELCGATPNKLPGIA